MVMDATQPQQPSPQSVGREFVRQYYTLLNKAPNHLHRFYNNNSSFVHGESSLVVGQKNIHNRIQQLNFHDCHAKISQVDAQATLGNGVVVQVTGELSNDGQPMRRFTQTFVLASQSPKKYYVHNDIFRYQDLYSDEENDGESRSENDDEHDQQVATQTGQLVPGTATITEQQPGQVLTPEQHQQQVPTQVVAGGSGATGVMSQQAQAVYYSMPTGAGRPMAVLPPPPGAAPVPIGANFAAAAVPPPQQQSVQTNTVAVNQLNGVVGPEELIATMPQQNVVQQQPPLTNQTSSPVVPQPAGTVSVATSAVIGAQVPTCVSGVPVATATAGLPQNVVTTMPSYQQQTPLIQTHILQQQQPPQQQPIPNSVSQQTHIQQQPVQNLTNTAMTEVEDSICSMVITQNVTLQVEQTRPNTAANVVASGQSTSPTVSNVAPEPNQVTVVEDFKTINDQQQQEKYEAAKQQQQSEPKTYANLFKSTSSSPSSFVNAALQQQQQIQQQQQSSSSAYQTTGTISSTTFSQSTLANTSMSIYGNRSNNENNSSARQDTNSQGGGAPLPQRQNAKGFNKDFEQRRTNNNQQFGDNQQLFLGNIPHHASEEELKALFARFGTIVDLRILSKSTGKLPPGIRNPQNYGFITYEDAESVQNCLAHCPLYFPENSPDRQKLNVEEKKPRTRTNDLPPRQSMGGGAGGMNNSINSNQRNMNSGGPTSRSLSNSGSAGGGSMMRGNNSNNNNNMSRGGSSGPRMSGSFNRSDNRASNGGSGSQMRGCNNNAQSSSSSYGVRR
uniref:NTF2 domain-containing protein n=1 Tax=Glossina brevipalpis TaxID=37001 RepID=A0A1A9W6F6_9MUSC